MKTGTHSANSFSHLLALARGARDGKTECAIILARRLQKFKNPKSFIKRLRASLQKEEARRQHEAKRRERRKDQKERVQFPTNHPLFRKKRSRKGRKQTDAMHRAILCGAFEMNRSRH